jgi:hypothetical protein
MTSEEELFNPPDHAEPQLRMLNIELKKLSVEAEIQRIKEEKAASEIRTRRLEGELRLAEEMKLTLFKELRDDHKAERRKKNEELRFRMSISFILISAGLWLISKNEQLGAYLLGTGATGAGLSATTDLFAKENGRGTSQSPAPERKSPE